MKNKNKDEDKKVKTATEKRKQFMFEVRTKPATKEQLKSSDIYREMKDGTSYYPGNDR